MSNNPLPGLHCAYCSSLIDDYTPVEDGTVPVEGDGMMCVYCGNLNIYCDEKTVRKLNKDELAEFAKDLLRTAKEKVAHGEYGTSWNRRHRPA